MSPRGQADEGAGAGHPCRVGVGRMDRRRFLQLMGLLGAAVPMGACSDDQEASARRVELGGDLQGEPFAVWEELRNALRLSPDHLPARAERLVGAGDPATIFEFVRDEVAVIPGSRARWVSWRRAAAGGRGPRSDVERERRARRWICWRSFYAGPVTTPRS